MTCCHGCLTPSQRRQIADSVIYSRTTKDLWQELEDRFGQSNGTQLYHLQKELNDLVQGSNDIAGYFTKIKSLWDELDALNTSVNCTCDCQCGGKAKMGKFLQDERLVQFLMGLNDIYAAGKSNILMLSPLPSVNHAYSLLMQDEKQREIYMNSHYPGNSATFLATNQNALGQKSRYQESKQKKTTLVCSNCKKPGHSVGKYYRIIGFPNDFKLTKTKKFQGNVKSNVVFMEGAQEQNEAHFGGEGKAQHFIQDQCSQLIQMLQNVKMNQPEGSSGDASANAVTCAGNVFKSHHKIIRFTYQSWLLDSGATQHMCFDSKIFLELSTLKSPIFVDLPNSYRVKVTQSGSISLHPKLVLKDVLFVPCFKYNLISVYNLCK